jgi:hypothetical protein
MLLVRQSLHVFPQGLLSCIVSLLLALLVFGSKYIYPHIFTLSSFLYLALKYPNIHPVLSRTISLW